MTSYAAAARADLVAALRAADPEAPTLCEGWTARDLAAHLVVRERRPDSTPGILIPLFAGWTERVRAAAARRPYGELVDLVASGPPVYSPFRIPGVDELANLFEYLVHTEDVRRGTPGWTARELPAGLQDRIWSLLTRGSTVLYRRAGVAVTLARPDGAEHLASRSGEPVTVVGEPLELLLYSQGRRACAQVELKGSETALAGLARAPLGI